MSRTKAALMDGRLSWPTETPEEEAQRTEMEDIEEARCVCEVTDRGDKPSGCVNQHSYNMAQARQGVEMTKHRQEESVRRTQNKALPAEQDVREDNAFGPDGLCDLAADLMASSRHDAEIAGALSDAGDEIRWLRDRLEEKQRDNTRLSLGIANLRASNERLMQAEDCVTTARVKVYAWHNKRLGKRGAKFYRDIAQALGLNLPTRRLRKRPQ